MVTAKIVVMEGTKMPSHEDWSDMKWDEKSGMYFNTPRVKVPGLYCELEDGNCRDMTENGCTGSCFLKREVERQKKEGTK